MPSKTDTAAPRPTVRNTIPTPPEWAAIHGPTISRYWSPQDAAAETGIPVATVRDWVYKREFPTVRAGRSVLIPTVSFLAWLAQVPARPAGRA
jgi:excisionase family DNA binding protein